MKPGEIVVSDDDYKTAHQVCYSNAEWAAAARIAKSRGLSRSMFFRAILAELADGGSIRTDIAIPNDGKRVSRSVYYSRREWSLALELAKKIGLSRPMLLRVLLAYHRQKARKSGGV